MYKDCHASLYRTTCRLGYRGTQYVLSEPTTVVHLKTLTRRQSSTSSTWWWQQLETIHGDRVKLLIVAILKVVVDGMTMTTTAAMDHHCQLAGGSIWNDWSDSGCPCHYKRGIKKQNAY
jgi:hypothetical protein